MTHLEMLTLISEAEVNFPAFKIPLNPRMLGSLMSQSRRGSYNKATVILGSSAYTSLRATPEFDTVFDPYTKVDIVVGALYGVPVFSDVHLPEPVLPADAVYIFSINNKGGIDDIFAFKTTT